MASWMLGQATFWMHLAVHAATVSAGSFSCVFWQITRETARTRRERERQRERKKLTEAEAVREGAKGGKDYWM